jgi:hypothetical protein
MDLKGGFTTKDPRLDRIYAQDLSSLNFLVRRTMTEVQKKPRSYTWFVGQWLDQGQEGACVGFGYSHELCAKPVHVIGVSDRFAREQIYWEAQKKDPWPGGSYPGATPQYEGTSVLTGAQILTELGFYTGYNWGITVQEIALAIGYKGPAVLGITMYEQMMDPNKDGFLVPEGSEVGGHCILAHSVTIKYKGFIGWISRNWNDVDLDKSYVTVWNSWGPSWGDKGTAKISLRSMEKLIVEDKGEACFPVRNTRKVAV